MRAWDTFLDSLNEQMGQKVVDQWLKPLRIVRFDARNLYLEPKSAFHIEWFDQHVRSLAKEKLLNDSLLPIEVHFTKFVKEKKKKNRAGPGIGSDPLLRDQGQITSDRIDATALFETFLIDPHLDKNNHLPCRLLKNLELGTINPIFLSGPKGVGKTHLLMACAHLLRKQNLNVFFVHTETFTQHVVWAIRSGQMAAFRKTYRAVDVLIVDDVHLLARRSSTQEEFFHTFNTLHTAKKQILLASHLSPGKLEEIEPRLTSRFEWGISMELYPLSSQMIYSVLQKRAEHLNFPLSDPITSWICQTFTSDTQSTLCALDALILRWKGKEEPSSEEAQRLLFDLVKEEKKKEVNFEKILAATANYFGLIPKEILSSSQTKEISFARKLAMFLCRKKLQLSYPAIGRSFDRDHSTALASIRDIEKKRGLDWVETPLKEIEQILKS